MTRKPGDRGGGPPLGPGGKAAERLNMFYEARGISKDPGVDRSYRDYPAAVLAAITAAEAAAQGQAGLPQWYALGPDLIPRGQTGVDATRVSVSGRISGIAIDPQNSSHLLCASGAGGIWESFTRGASWAARTDSMPTLTTGAIAFDPGNANNNTNFVYAGTGEGNKFWFMGQGMLRSADGGTTWALLPGAASQADGTVLPGTPFAGTGFYQIIVDPANSQHILAGVNGFAATNGGLYQTNNGGANWTRVIATADCFDISMQPGGGAAAEVLAATDGGLMRSADGGTTWAAVALPGAPAGWTRLAVSISPRDPTVAFAFGASSGNLSGPYLWRRSGGAWSAVTPLPGDLATGQAAYDWYVAAAPAGFPGPGNTDQVYLGAIDVHRGDLAADGVSWTWANLSTKNPGDCIHADQHAIAFDTANAGTIYCGGDGGVFRSPDRGVSWVSLNPGLGITEIEYMVNYNGNSRWMLAGTQDNGTLRYQGTGAFEHVDDGDGGDCGVDQAVPGQAIAGQANPVTCYDTFIRMKMYRSTQGGASGTFRNITPPIPNPLPSGYSLFYPPVGVSGATIAIAGRSVFVSRDTGNNWTEVPLPAPLVAGGPAEIATALYLSGTDLVYAATKTGRIFTITYTPATAAWSNPPAEVTRPRNAYISAIRVDASGRIWVTMTQVGNAQAGGQVWRSADSGRTWTDVTANLPPIPVSAIAFGNFTRNGAGRSGVWVAADVGVYESIDDGVTWSPFFQNLPYAIVEDLEFDSATRLLRAGTRSRGIWEAAVEKPGSSAPPPAQNACAVLNYQNNNGAVFSVGTNKTLGYAYGGGDWSLWTPLGGVATSAVAAASLADGTLDVFARGADGALWHVRQILPGYTWSGWESLGGFLTGNPAVTRNLNPQGLSIRLEAFARGADGTLQHIYQRDPGGNWSAWESLGGVITGTPAAILNADARVEAFARGSDGALWHIYQTQPAFSAWSSWESLGGTIIGEPAVIRNKDGRVEVLARGPDGALWHTYQTSPPAAGQTGRPGSSWSAWESLGGTLAGDPAVAPNQDGRLEAFARGNDGAVWHIWQTAPNALAAAGWSAWGSLGGTITSDPAVVLNPSAAVEVFARWTDNTVWHAWQTPLNSGFESSPGSGWSYWLQLGPFAQAGQIQSGTILVFP